MAPVGDGPGRWGRAAPRGAALPLVLLLLLTLTALAHGVFLVALEEGAAARASGAVSGARIAAEGGLRRTLAALLEDTLPRLGDEVLVLGEGALRDARFRVELRRLSEETWWAEGIGAAALSPGGPPRVEERVARVVWALSPLERLRAFSAAVEHGGPLEVEGILDAGSAGDPGTLDAPTGCRDRRDVLDAVLAGRLLAPARRVGFEENGALPPLGLLGHDTLLARVDARIAGVVEPGPVVEGGRCSAAAPLNWGSPSEPDGPCGGHRPALASEEDLTLVGGEGQGLLLVSGDLRLAGGARWAGLALVGGDLTLEGGAVLEGLARVRGSVRVAAGARIGGAVCPALLALEQASVLRLPLHVPDGGWIRPF